MTRPVVTAILVLAACLTAVPTLAGSEIRSERVQFEVNTSGATINAKIKGRETVDYLLGARAGQNLSVTMHTDNGANYFNIIPPDADNETIFVLAPGTGGERILYFSNGEWSTDSAEPVQAGKRSDLWTLVVSDEAYEVPEAVLFGG